MATTNHRTADKVTFTEAAAAATVTSALPAPGATNAWRIEALSFFGTGAFTVWSVDVQESGGTSCFKVGATSAVNPGSIPGPIATKVNDAPNVVLTLTGSTAVVLNVIATLVPGNPAG